MHRTGGSASSRRPSRASAAARGASSEPVRQLRERLYRPEATETDVAAFLAATSVTPEPTVIAAAAPVPVSDAARARTCAGVLAAAAVVVVALLLAAVPGPDAQRPHDSVSRTASVRAEPSALSAAQRDRVSGLLRGSSSGADVAALRSIVTEAVAPLRAPDSARSSGTGTGGAAIRLGALGVTAGGHALRVVVAAPAGYRWVLLGSRGGRRHPLARTVWSGPELVSSAAVGVPRGFRDLTLRLEGAAGQRYFYALVASS